MSTVEKHEAEQARLTALCESGECGHAHCLREYDERRADRNEEAADLLREVAALERDFNDEFGDVIIDGQTDLFDRIQAWAKATT